VSDELAVWLDDTHVATLRRTRRDQLQLQYTEDAVSTHGVGSVAMSVALPTAARPYAGRHVEYWAESVLPEGETRTHIEQQFGVRRGDTFALLTAIGSDCAGAISFLPPGAPPVELLTTATPLDDRGLAAAVEDLPTHPLGVDEDVRVSLGGLQAKLLLTRTPDGQWARPTGGAPSTHILKPDPAAWPGLVASEAFTLRMAALAGLPAAVGKLLTVGGRDSLLLARFDRIARGDTVKRLHQEDICSALGVDPTGDKKYQSLGSDTPTLARIADLLATHGSDRRTDLVQLAEAVTLRVAVGDTDGHARNYGVLHIGAAVRLAPLYDAAPTYQFARGRQVGVWVGGQSMLSAITVRHLTDEFRSWRIPAGLAQQIPVQVLERLRDSLPLATGDVPQVRGDIVEAVQGRIDRLLDTAGS
jgi:serine/threonine-protein kinase HipA